MTNLKRNVKKTSQKSIIKSLKAEKSDVDVKTLVEKSKSIIEKWSDSSYRPYTRNDIYYRCEFLPSMWLVRDRNYSDSEMDELQSIPEENVIKYFERIINSGKNSNIRGKIIFKFNNGRKKTIGLF